ncbi:MAG TPA: acyltransferase [Actinomycetota bacterium]
MGRDLDALVAATPATRDRVADFLRAASICAVVFGHWFIGLIFWQDGIMRTRSAIGVTPLLWLLTWGFQVMPIFFFVGGFSNLVSLDGAHRRGETTTSFVRSRVGRLLRPSLVFFAVWGAVMLALHLFDVGSPTGPRVWGETTLLRVFLPPGATLPFGPLWFLAVYLGVVCLAPALIALHRRYRWTVVWVMAGGAVAADVLGFPFGLGLARWANVAFVLLLPHQLGFFYADGTLARLPRRVFWAMVIGGLAGLVLLTSAPLWTVFGDVRFDWFPGIGHYPKSLLGTDVELVSNAYPPTVCYLLGGVWAIGAVMLLRDRLARWLERPRPWKVTIVLNSVIMTLFLWHMTAFLLAIFALWPLGFGRDHDGGIRWWLERPLWIGVPALFLVLLVRVFGRFERPPRRS